MDVTSAAFLAIGSVTLVLIMTFLFLIYKKMGSPSAESGDSQIAVQMAGLKKDLDRIFEPNEGEISKIHKNIESFNRTILGTSTRGKVGEQLLKEKLKPFIESGQIKTNVKIDGGVVEFAWELPDGNYVPVDAKLPDVDRLVKEFEETDDENKKRVGKEIKDKIKKQIPAIRKYQNSSKTIDRCVLVVPGSILGMFPELFEEGASQGVVVCSFENVYMHLFLLAREHEILTEKGDVGKYKKILEQYQRIMENVREKTGTIDRGMKIIETANDEIKDSARKSHKFE